MKSAKLAVMAGLSLALAACGSGDAGGAQSDDAGSTEVAVAAQDNAAAASASGGEAPVAFAQCKACHSVEPGQMGIGPSLAGIYGTKAGDVEGYQFSTAMKESGLVWDEKTLDAYLENPQKVVPGTKMSFFGLKDADKRHQVIEYIESLK